MRGKYIVTIYDVGSGSDKKILEEITLEADDKNSVIDKAHDYAFDKYSGVRHFIEIREEIVYLV